MHFEQVVVRLPVLLYHFILGEIFKKLTLMNLYGILSRVISTVRCLQTSMNVEGKGGKS